MDINQALAESNSFKSLSGREINNLIVAELNILVREGVIASYETDVNFRHRDFGYENQFLVNFVITTLDLKKIIVRRSNSFRIDRAKIGFYDLDGIVRLSDFSKEIIASIYLVSEGELDETSFVNTRELFRSGVYYCPATHLFVVSEFISFLNAYSDDQSTILEGIKDEQEFESLTEAGSYYGRQGNKIEKEITSLLNDYEFFQEYKYGKSTSKYSMVLDTILRNMYVEKENILRIQATNTIPLLLSGGNPKSDIFIEIFMDNRQQFSTGISIKNTDKDRVTCHDYTASAFINVLKCEGTKLADYLRLFEKFPTYADFRANLSTPDSEQEFADLLSEKRDILSEWCIKGSHDSVNLVNPLMQVSNYILINTTNDVYFFESDEYIEYITKNTLLKYSTPFSWTYPSKQRGKRIQLKMPIYYSLD